VFLNGRRHNRVHHSVVRASSNSSLFNFVVTFFLLDDSATSPEDEIKETATLLHSAMNVEHTVVLLIFTVEGSHASFPHVTTDFRVGSTDYLLNFNGSTRPSDN
jgi:hypothetical protein